jgi:hypothetical protein
MKSGLSRSPALGTGRKGIKPILQDIEIEGAHLYCTKVLNTVVDRVELKTLISLANPGDEFLKLMESPPVHLVEFRIRNPVFLRVEVVEVPKEKAKGVSDPKVAIGQAFEDFIGDLDVIFVILCRHPEPQDIGSQSVDDLFGRDHVPR